MKIKLVWNNLTSDIHFKLQLVHKCICTYISSCDERWPSTLRCSSVAFLWTELLYTSGKPLNFESPISRPCNLLIIFIYLFIYLFQCFLFSFIYFYFYFYFYFFFYYNYFFYFYLFIYLFFFFCSLVVLGSSPPPCYQLNFFSVVPSSTPCMPFVNSQLVCFQPVGIFKVFRFIWSTEIFVSVFGYICPERPHFGSGQFIKILIKSFIYLFIYKFIYIFIYLIFIYLFIYFLQCILCFLWTIPYSCEGYMGKSFVLCRSVFLMSHFNRNLWRCKLTVV